MWKRRDRPLNVDTHGRKRIEKIETQNNLIITYIEVQRNELNFDFGGKKPGQRIEERQPVSQMENISNRAINTLLKSANVKRYKKLST